MRRLLILVFAVALSASVRAADVYWIGSGTHSWFEPAAWVGGAVPNDTDRVFFTGSGTCNLDWFVYAAHIELMPTFTGNVVQQNWPLAILPRDTVLDKGLFIYGGTFTGGTASIRLVEYGFFPIAPHISIPVSLTIDGGTFINSLGGFEIEGGELNFYSGVFNHNNSWVKMVGPVSNWNGGFIRGNPVFYKLHCRGFRVETEITVLDTFLRSGGIMSGVVHAKSNVVLARLYSAGGGTIIMDGTGDQHLVGTTDSTQLVEVENITFDKPSGSIYLHDHIKALGKWTYIAGNLVAGTSTISFGPNLISGTHTLYNVKFVGSSSTNPTINPGDTLTVANNLFFNAGPNAASIIQGGEIFVQGDLIIPSTANLLPIYPAFQTGRFVINGTGDQMIRGGTKRYRGYVPGLVIDKPSGTLFLKDTIVTNAGWTYIRGNVDALTHNSYVQFTSATPNHPRIIDGEGATSTMLFNNIEIGYLSSSTPFTRYTLLGDLRVKNRIVLDKNRIDPNGHNIYFENNLAMPVSASTGYIEYDKLNGAPLYWDIGDATGTFTLALGLSTTQPNQLPMVLNVITPGSSGGAGRLSFATYNTDHTQNPNNRPFPAGVTNLDGFLGIENALRAVDRYWLFDCANYSMPPAYTVTGLPYMDSEWLTAPNAIDEINLRTFRWNSADSTWVQTSDLPNVASNTPTFTNVACNNIFTIMENGANAVISASDNVICGDTGTIQFSDDHPVVPVSRQWFFPGGVPGSSTAPNPTVIYNTPGTYDVIFEATYPNGVLSDTLYDFIVIDGTMLITLTPTATCGSANSGSIQVNMTGGTPPYQFHWSTGTSTLNTILTGLAPGTYSLSVIDGFGCTATDTTAVLQHPAITITPGTVTPQTACGLCDGSASVIPSGGTGLYSYVWDNGQTTQTATNLCAGIHGVTVTDVNTLCNAVTSITIAQPSNITLTTLHTDASCNGLADGGASVDATGGATPYFYTWNQGVPVGAGDSVTTLSAGTITVTVTDANGCSDTAVVIIGEPLAISATFSVIDVTCNGASDGAVILTAANGTPPYTYTWSSGTPGGTPETVTNLDAGTVVVTITDINGCAVTDSVTVGEPAPLTINGIVTPGACGPNGSIDVTVTGGTGPYTALWSNAVIVEDLLGLSTGTYTITVADANVCTDSATFIVQQPSAAVLSVQVTNSSSCTACNGSATVVATGGAAPFQYLWTPGNQTTATITNLCAGIYTANIIDTHGCTATINAIVNSDTSFSLTQYSSGEDCNNPADTVTLVLSGTNTPFAVQWGDTAAVTVTNDTAVHVYTIAGIYLITVTDAAQCFRATTDTVDDLAISVSLLQTVHPICTASNGKIKVAGADGVAPYTYLWNNNATTDSISSLTAGTYTVTVTDDNGCNAIASYTLNAITTPINTAITSAGANCTLGTGGSATVQPSGGTPPYTYIWSTGETAPTLAGLSLGTYYVTVVDINGCSGTNSTNIGYIPNSFYVFIDPILPNCNTPGSLTASPGSSSGSFTYLWSTGQTMQTATGLMPGTYSVTVTSSGGCQRTGTYTLAAQCNNLLSGTLFIDLNGNCVQDSAEAAVPQTTLIASDGTNNYYGYTAQDGSYSIRIPVAGTFTLTALLGPSTCSTLQFCGTPQVTFNSVGDVVTNYNVAVSATALYDLTVGMGWTSANPGFQKRYWFTAYNRSVLPFTGTATVTFNYDDDLVFTSASVPPASHDAVNHTLTWIMNNIQAYAFSNSINVYFDVPATLPITHPLTSTLHIDPTANDCNIPNNTVTVTTSVIGAIDPNMKEVLPAGNISESDSVLTYTVHFQNTGSDTTHFVILRDTLSEHVDPATVENIASSHQWSGYEVTGSGILAWVFNPIFLPDSATDEPGSKGFVMFRVKKKPGVPIGTEITNSASIYFDYNTAIVTNTVKSRMIDPNWIFAPSESSVTVRTAPNPFSDITFVTVEGVNEQFDFTLYDIFGKEVRRITVPESNTFEVPRNELARGIYFYRITVGGKAVGNGKVIVG